MNDVMSVAPRAAPPGGTSQVLWLTIAAVLVLVAVAAAASLVISRELRASRASYTEVLRTRETLEQVRIVFSTLQDAESGERGYVLTGSEEVLEPYYAAARSLETELTKLNRLAADVEGRQIASDLAELAHAQLALARNVVAVRRSQGAAAALDLVRPGTGKRQMDRIRELIGALDAHEKQLLSKRLAAFERRSQRTEGTIQTSLSAAILLMLAAGALLVRHTQRRVRAEGAAREAFSLLRSTMDNVTQGVAVFDASQRLVAWNALYLDLRGLDPAQVHEGKSWTEILREGAKFVVFDQAGKLDANAVPAIMAAAGRSFELEDNRDDGAVLQVRGRRMPDGNYIVTYTDVTALKLSETAYREQATRLSSILDNVVDAIVTINESGSIESWNLGAERLFGYGAAEILRRNVRVLMPDPHSSAHDGYIRRFMQTGERRIIGQRREVRALHKDGRRIPVDVGISEMRIGARRLFIGILRDLSSSQEIEQLKSGFVSTVSHELRTPLTSISGSLGLLAGGIAGALPGKAAHLIDIARLNCERLVRLINDILDLEKAESGRLELRLESQPLKPIVQQAMELNRAYAQTFGATIELAADSDEVDVLVDRDRLIQALTNILSNAAKFSPRGAAVLVAIRAETDFVRVNVYDQGPGVAPDFQHRIFQRFAQADSSDSRAGGGAGLGLSIAKTIMERLGGSIGFDSVHGQGTTFYVRLPVRHEVTTPIRAGDEVLGLLELHGRRARILHVEDDESLTRLVSELLSDEAEVIPARSLAQARLLIETGRYDLVILDIALGDGSGLELLPVLRQGPMPPPVILYSATEPSRELSNMVQAALVKSRDSVEQLLETVRKLASRDMAAEGG